MNEPPQRFQQMLYDFLLERGYIEQILILQEEGEECE